MQSCSRKYDVEKYKHNKKVNGGNRAKGNDGVTRKKRDNKRQTKDIKKDFANITYV